jgi:UDP-N-acetylmuramoyl-tripeptide--D-alanyl-D-alanine ligase
MAGALAGQTNIRFSMKPLSLDEIASAANGQLVGPASLIGSISTDTRKLKPRSLFIAIKGENHDGHDHVAAAIANGAAAAMVHQDLSTPNGFTLIKVDDTRRAMGRLANFVRRRLPCAVIGVAGSNGKTGTKHLINAALAGKLRGSTSPKSFNNDIGVPLTIFDADPSHDYVVLEMGTNHPGEILNLTNIAEPNIAVITSIGAEHLEFLGDLDGVRRENAAIIQGMKPDGLLVINGDDDGLQNAVAGFPGRTITFGFNSENQLRVTDFFATENGIQFRANGVGPMFTVPLLGRHAASNALAAVAVARHLGVDDATIAAGLARSTGPEWRLQIQKAGGVTILNDAYNANPHSMRAALETLRDMKATGRKIAILGDMRELGATADFHHREMGQFAAGCGLEALWCVGEKADLIAESATVSPDIRRFADAAECAATVASLLQNGDLVLLKASRGIGLEAVAEAIAKANI